MRGRLSNVDENSCRSKRKNRRRFQKEAHEVSTIKHCRVLEKQLKCGVTVCWSVSACGLAAGTLEAQLARLPAHKPQAYQFVRL